MNDEQMQSALDEWFEDTDPQPPNAQRTATHVMAQVPQTRQRGRWLPFRLFRPKAETPTATGTTEYQPSPIPASNGHTPTVIGRTSSMLSPVKAITAGAIIFAIGGVMLIAQPFQQPDSVPGAESKPIAPTWVTGTDYWAPSCSGPTETEIDGDVTHERGYVCEPTRMETNDPRLTGEGTWSWNADVFTTDEGQRTVIYGAEYLRNEGGGWTCPMYRLSNHSGFIPDQYNSSDITLCVGDGEYEGLSALLVLGEVAGNGQSIVGLIFSGDAPPLPGPPAVE